MKLFLTLLTSNPNQVPGIAWNREITLLRRTSMPPSLAIAQHYSIVYDTTYIYEYYTQAQDEITGLQRQL